MKKAILHIFHFSFVLLFLSGMLHAQTHTVGLLAHDMGSEDDGYVLFSPVDGSDTTYLIDKCGREVHKWRANFTPGLDVYLLPDGTLLRTGHYANSVFDPSGGSAGGIIQRYDWDGNLLWHYLVCNATETQNHDVCYLPNGNILVDIWEVIPDSVAIANGRNPALLGTSLWSAKVIEIQPVGTNSANIVWTWRAWDHLIQDFDSTKPNYGVVADHPELLNLNYCNTAAAAATNPDWLHFNAVTYNPTLDQVMISFHNLDEIYILDHSTDSATAASHSGGTHNKGGDFLYRWGNPGAYGRGSVLNIKLFQQHDPIWITSGKYANQIMIFNNGNGRPGLYASSVDIIAPPIDSAGNYTIDSGVAYGPTALTWTYETAIPNGSFYSAFMGGAQPLDNGNTLICDAIKGHLFEIDSSKNIVWDYINPVNNGAPVAQGTTPINLNSVYRCLFYPKTYPGFAGHDLAGGDPIEKNPLPSSCTLGTTTLAVTAPILKITPNPANSSVTIETDHLQSVILMDITGRIFLNELFGSLPSGTINTAYLPEGVYILCVNGTQYQRLLIQH